MSESLRQAALREASVPTLLMCLAQITRDPRWLEDPFLPKRDISIFAEPTGGLSDQAQASVRDATSQLLDDLAAGRAKLPPLPTEDELSRMMSVCVGEKVPREYAAMAMEDRQQILTSQTADHQEAILARVAKRAPDYRDC